MDSLAVAKLPPNAKNGTMASYGDDSTILANFDDEFVVNEYKTEMEGKPVYDHFIKISLEYPGNNLFNFHSRFTPEDGKLGNKWTQRFPHQWGAFVAQKEQVPNGTPIELWPPLDKKRVFELKAMKVFTVEQLAGLTDATGPNVGMDWRKMRDMANAFLNPEVGQVTISRLNRENQDQKTRIEVLERQISALANSTSVPLEEAPKRRGRPPKEQTQA